MFPVLGARIIKLLPHVYQVNLRRANVFVLEEEGGLTLIDTGLPGGTNHILGFLSRLGHSPKEVTLILITHHHWDHIGSLAELKALTQAKVAIHRADATVAPYPFPLPSLLRFRPFSGLRRLVLAPPSLFDLLLDGGEVLPLLGGLRVIPTPGHTPGSISLYVPQYKLLLVGDALAYRGGRLTFPYRLASVDPALGRESAKRLARLEVEVLGFGHGRSILHGAGGMLRALS